jgi:hypothetical protein
LKLYHISEEPDIEVFEPRPSPQNSESIKGNVVFAVNDIMLHNYLLPRDCPRVTYYAKADSLQNDIDKFIGNSKKNFIINIEESWLERVEQTKLYLYELPSESFELLDQNAGYYVSYEIVKPVKIMTIENLLAKIEKRNVELRIMPSLKQLANDVSESTLQFSIIRMRNAFH